MMYFLKCILTFLFVTSCSITDAIPVADGGILSDNRDVARVIIIGAGASGVAAASRLLSNNISDVIILEAQDYIGGRIQFIESPDNLGADMGAHWLDGKEGNIAYAMAEPLGLVEPSGDYDKPLILHRPDGSVFEPSPVILNFFYELFKHNFPELPHHNTSLAAYIIEKLKGFQGEIDINDEDLKLLTSYTSISMCSLEACGSTSDVSTKLLEGIIDEEGIQYAMFKKQGYNNILDLLMRTHAIFDGKDPLPVRQKTRFGERVTSIDWSGEKAVVTTEKGTVFQADIVLVTVSLAVLKAGNIKFMPSLPNDKQDAIEALGMDVVDKIYLFFDERWWPQNISGYGLLQEVKSNGHWGDEISAFVSQKSNPKALIGWIAGDAARSMEEDSDENVIETCKRLLDKFVGPTQEVPPIRGMVRSRWASNKDIRGAYSYPSVAAENLLNPRETLAKPMLNSKGIPVIRWAGEATSTHMYGTVHGAMTTGFREADEIIKFINK